MGKEVECLLDKDEFRKSYGLFWLWLHGAFEVVRTMHAAKSRFSPNAGIALTKLKGRLARLRATMAKQKLTDGKAIYAELSVSRFDSNTKDYCFIVEGKAYWMRALIKEINQLVSSIEAKDIVSEGGKLR